MYLRKCCSPIVTPVADLDLRSEFLYQSSLERAEHTDPPLNTSYAWDISHALATLYHPYAQSPSALTEYLKRKLQVQRAKRRSRSHPAQVEPNAPLERNTLPVEYGLLMVFTILKCVHLYGMTDVSL